MSYSSYNPPSDDSDNNQSTESTDSNDYNTNYPDTSNPTTPTTSDSSYGSGSGGTGTTGLIDQDTINDIKEDLAQLEENDPDAYDQLIRALYEEYGEELNQILDDIATGGDASIIGKIIECHGGLFQLENSVTEYNTNNENTEPYQFPDCPNIFDDILEDINDAIQSDQEIQELDGWFYESGWNYQDYSIQDATGYVTSSVLLMRMAELGPPLTLDNETSNPNRIQNLPPRVTKLITTEPKKQLWIHPYLDRDREQVDKDGNVCIDSSGQITGNCDMSVYDDNGVQCKDKDGKDTGLCDPDFDGEYEFGENNVNFMSWSRFTTHDNWQSGPVANGPSDTDIYYYAGFHTSPGGKNAVNNQWKATEINFNQKGTITGYEGRWTAVLGNSRGFESMGYGDEPTEGMDYGVVGVSGWFTSGYNLSAGTQSNTGIKFIYTMNRIDTNAEELGYNVQKLGEILDDLASGASEGSYSLTDEAPDLTTLGTPGEDDWEPEDKDKIYQFWRRFEDWDTYFNKAYVDFDYKRVYRKGLFKKWSNILIGNDQSTINAVNLLFEFANDALHDHLGTPKSRRTYIIDPSIILSRMNKNKVVSFKDIYCNLLTQLSIKRADIVRKLKFDIDYEKVAQYSLGSDDPEFKKEFDRANYIIEVVENYDVAKFIVKDGKLSALLKSGLILTQDRFERGLLGFCDACVEFGGSVVGSGKGYFVDCQVLSYNNFSSFISEKDGLGGYELNSIESYRIDEDIESMRNVMGIYDTPYNSNVDEELKQNSRTLDSNNIANDQKAVTRPDGTTYYAGIWRGCYAIPQSAGPAAPGDWKPYIDGANRSMMTYGPFSPDELNTYYNWCFPPGLEGEDPRMDYGVTWWFDDKPDGLFNNSRNTKIAEPTSSPTSKGYNFGKPPAKYFRMTFWQWRAKTGNKKGPKIRESHYYPGKTVGGEQINGQSPKGVFFDVIVTPKVDNPMDLYKDPFSGPCYKAPDESAPLPEFNLAHWDDPINTIDRDKNNKAGWYKFWSVKPSEQTSEVFSERMEPEHQGLFSLIHPNTAEQGDDAYDGLNFTNQNSDGDYTYRNMWSKVTTIVPGGETNYRFVYFDDKTRVVLSAYDPSRPDTDQFGEIDWATGGEPWVDWLRVDTKKVKIGPAYWGELMSTRARPSFTNARWQTPLNTHSITRYVDFWSQHKDNIEKFKYGRIRIKANPGDVNAPDNPNKTKYDYDVYFAQEDAILDQYSFPQEHKSYRNFKPKFIYAGTIMRNDYVGFDITAPAHTDKMIFAARNTNRLHTDWKNNGEEVQLKIHDSVNPAGGYYYEYENGKLVEYYTENRDFIDGPAYWAFGDFGLGSIKKKGFRGYVDFNDAYFSNPLNHWNTFPAHAAIQVKAGKTYKITPGPNMRYSYRVIWGLNEDKSINPIYHFNPNLKNDRILDSPNEDNFYFEEDDKFLRPPQSGKNVPVTVKAQSDILLFGAFRYDNTDDKSGDHNTGVDRPEKETWSVNGEWIDVTIEEVIPTKGCSFWATDGGYNDNLSTNLSNFDAPYIHFTEECKITAQENNENIVELEKQEWERDLEIYPDEGTYATGENTDEDENTRTYKRVFEIKPGKSYALFRSDKTPNLDYRLKFLKERADLNKTNPTDVTPDELKTRVWRAGLDDEAPFLFDNAPSPYMVLEAFATNKPLDDWSKEGEPVYMSIYEGSEDNTIQGKQYWTDWTISASHPDPIANVKYKAETANRQLNSSHWDNPLWRIPADKLKPGKTYEIWAPTGNVNNGKANPEYQHVLFAGKDPESIIIGSEKDYTVLGTVGNQKKPIDQRESDPTRTTWLGESNKFKFTVPKSKPCILIGAWNTTAEKRNEGLTGWNKKGEDIKLKYREIDENYKGPCYWGAYTFKYGLESPNIPQGAYDRGYEEFLGFPDLGAGEDPTQETSNDNPPYYTNPYHYGENRGEPMIRQGEIYRITFSDLTQDEMKPDGYPFEMPYIYRMWWAHNRGNNKYEAMWPADSQYHNWEPGRWLQGSNFPYVDVQAPEDTLIFGATLQNQTGGTVNPEFRDFDSWSKNGEPLPFTVAHILGVSRGIAYDQSSRNELPNIEAPHFYKPINVERVTAGSLYEWKKGDQYADTKGTLQFWFMIDNKPSDHETASALLPQGQSYLPFHVDSQHPEDFLIPHPTEEWYIPDEIKDYFYKAGPIIDTQTTGEFNFTIPDDCSRMFIGQMNRFPSTPNTRAFNARINPNWGRMGESVPVQVREVEVTTEGPVYWGSLEGSPFPPNPAPGSFNHNFNNNHFVRPLKRVKLEKNETYICRLNGRLLDKAADAWIEYKKLEIYCFDPDNLPPSPEGFESLPDYKKIGELAYNSPTDGVIIFPTEKYIVFSAVDIRKNHPTTNEPLGNDNLTDWGVLGEPSLVEFEKVDTVQGPLYPAGTISVPPYTNYWPGGTLPDTKLPDWSNTHWEYNVNALKINNNGDYNLILEEKNDIYAMSIYGVKSNTHLMTGPTAKKTNWIHIGDIPRNTDPNDNKNTTWRVPEGIKYVAFGAYEQPPGQNRSILNWSPLGEPAPITTERIIWGRGPGYPANRKDGGKWKLDINEDRWVKPFPYPMKPFLKDEFKGGVKYEFKRNKTIKPEQKQWDYQLVWSKTMNPTTQNDLRYDTKDLSTSASIDKKFVLIAPSGGYKYLYFALHKAQGTVAGWGDPFMWSPDGTPVPWTCKKKRRELSDYFPPGLISAILAALAALLGALMATLFYFMAIAPLEVLIEMNEEHEFNEYPIQRKKLKEFEDEEGRLRQGYGYPHEEWMYSDDIYTGLKNDPIFFNYTSDIKVRAYSNLMKMRHNGYWFHVTNAKQNGSYLDFGNTHRMTFHNIAPVYGVNFTGLSAPGVKRSIRMYPDTDPLSRQPKKDRNITRFNPFSADGVKVLVPCVQTDKNKQSNPKWDDRLMWFKPTLSYSPMITKEGFWQSKAGAQYKLASNHTPGGEWYSWPTVDGTYNNLENIFNEKGAGLTIAKKFTSDGNHAFALEIINGDTNMIWPGQPTSAYKPGIEFDLRWDNRTESQSDQWQIIQMDLNFGYRDQFVENPQGFKTYETRKLEMDVGSDYKFRQSFDKSPQYDTMGQVSESNPSRHIIAVAKEKIDPEAILYSISMAVWAGKTNSLVKRHAIISNLKGIWRIRS